MLKRPFVGCYWVGLEPGRATSQVISGKASEITGGNVIGWVCSYDRPTDWKAVPLRQVVSAISLEERVQMEAALFHPEAVRSMDWYVDLLFEFLTPREAGKG